MIPSNNELKIEYPPFRNMIEEASGCLKGKGRFEKRLQQNRYRRKIQTQY